MALVVPDGIADHCCGTPWSSKGLAPGHATMTAKVRRWLAGATDGGRLPVVSDSATCSEGWARTVDEDGIRVVDAVAWVASDVLPTLPEGTRLGSLALHPTCSSVRAGLDGPLRAVAARVAHEVVVPDEWGCCGFAGDRGMLHPELTASATRVQAAAVTARHFDAHASVNRTCEIGMSRATGRPYLPLLELLERVTRR